MSGSVAPVDEVYVATGRPIQHLRSVKTGHGIRMSWRDGKRLKFAVTFWPGYNRANWGEDGYWLHGWTKWHDGLGFVPVLVALPKWIRGVTSESQVVNKQYLYVTNFRVNGNVDEWVLYSLRFYKTERERRSEKGEKKGKKWQTNRVVAFRSRLVPPS